MKKFISANQLKRHMITHSGKTHAFNSVEITTGVCHLTFRSTERSAGGLAVGCGAAIH